MREVVLAIRRTKSKALEYVSMHSLETAPGLRGMQVGRCFYYAMGRCVEAGYGRDSGIAGACPHVTTYRLLALVHDGNFAFVSPADGSPWADGARCARTFWEEQGERFLEDLLEDPLRLDISTIPLDPELHVVIGCLA